MNLSTNQQSLSYSAVSADLQIPTKLDICFPFLLITNPIVQNFIERYQRALKQSLVFIACTRLESLASHQTCFPWDLFLFRQLIVVQKERKLTPAKA